MKRIIILTMSTNSNECTDFIADDLKEKINSDTNDYKLLGLQSIKVKDLENVTKNSKFENPIKPIPLNEDEKIVHCIDCKYIDIIGHTAYCSNPYGMQNLQVSCTDYCSRGEE